MKRKYLRAGVTVATMFLALNTVNATDLTSQIETGTSGLGDSIKFEKNYDNDKDLNKITVKLLVDKNAINTVLNQVSGDGSELSIFYFSVDPKFEDGNFKKGVVWYGEGLQRKTYEEALAYLESATPGEDKTVDDVVWVNALSVQYYDEASGTWKVSDTKGNGTISIKADLLNKLNLTDENDLVYGENYRFSMYDKYTQVWQWNILDDEDKTTKSELVAIDWKIEFPVAGKVEDRQVLFATLEEALKSEAKEIFINKNLTVDEDVVIPADVTLTIVEGVTLEIEEGTSFENEGTVLGNVKVDGVEKTYGVVAVKDTTNGKVVVDKNNVASGETVTVTATADKDYQLDTLKVLDKVTGKEVEVKDGKFVMPKNDVEVVATFKAVTKVKNPNTGDNIVLYLVAGMLSFGAIIFNSKLFKKIFN